MSPALLLLACHSSPGSLAPLAPTSAPAAVLLAQLGPDLVTVDNVVLSDPATGVEQTVDLDLATDDGGDERFGFRYQVKDDAGNVLYERSTSGPAIVQEFLDYYSDITGLDVLGMLPGLGEFPITVPLIDGGTDVAFQFRSADGYVELGHHSLTNLDAEDVGLSELVIGTATLHEGGPSQNRLDLALVGDGYTEADMDRWYSDAQALTDAILDIEPYRSHATWVNIHRVDAVSHDCGVSYDCEPECTMRDTAFGTIFAMELVNRFIGTGYRTTPVFQLHQWEVARAVGHVPWDAVIVVANTVHSGGMAVHYATVPNGDADWTATGVHELGHGFGLLGDEYVEDYCIRSDTLGLPENITDRGEDPPWPQWIDADTPLPTPDERGYRHVVGAFEGAYNCDDLYRPAKACRMLDSSGGEFCPVCAEALTRRLFRHADAIDGVTINESGNGHVSLSADIPDGAVSLSWTVDGAAVGTGDELEVDVEPGQEIALDAVWSSEIVREDHGDLGEHWGWRVGENGP